MHLIRTYKLYLHVHHRTMLQVDPRRRPRVEELEALPALQPAMTAARGTLNDFKQQQVLSCCTAVF